MIDLKRLRDEPEYRTGIERKRVKPGLIDEVLGADTIARGVSQEVEALRARQNAASKEIGKASPDERPKKIEAAATLKEELAVKEKELQAADDLLRALALQIPNPSDQSSPDGGEDDGEVV
jgi:seryl-tRNA synthetase